MISDRFKCIFIHIPKCAGTSVEAAFGHLDGYSGRRAQDHRTLRAIERPRLTMKVLKDRESIKELARSVNMPFQKGSNPKNKITVNRRQYREYTKLTFVRNPWARAYSWYSNVVRDDVHRSRLMLDEPMSFDEFVRKFNGTGMLRPQTYWLKDYSGAIPFDFIGRFENLNSDFMKMCELIDIEPMQLPSKIRSERVEYQDKYSAETREAIARICSEEIELFNYKFE